MSETRFSVGQKCQRTRRIAPEDVRAFADLVDDHNPVHLDPAFAEKTRFGRPVAHGMLTGSLFSGILGMEFPGPGTVYLSQSLRFLAPVFVGDEVTVSVELAELLPKGRARFFTRARCGERLVIEGEAEVLLPRLT